MTQAAVLGANASIMSTPVGTAPGYQCRAWVNFNGTGTVAIRGSGNVTSITDNGVGLYQVNLTTAMPDTNYAAVATVGAGTVSNASESTQITAFSTGNFQVAVGSDGPGGATYTYQDATFVSCTIFR